MKIEFFNEVDKSFLTECIMNCIPCVNDHICFFGTEWIVTGRLFEPIGKTKIYVRKATRNDITFM